MKALCLLSFVGLAAGGFANAQSRPEIQTDSFSGQQFNAIRATAVTGLTMDGRYVYGKTIELGNANTSRGALTTAYDSAFLSEVDGLVCGDVSPHSGAGPSNRYFFGAGFSWQTYAEDIIPAAGTEGGVVDTFNMFGAVPLCDGGTGSTSEPLQIVIESWEGFDNFPDLDGSDGFDTDGDGLGFPISLSDNDGDTFVDEFIGAVILTYANTDTDGDTQPDEFRSNGSLGYGQFNATGLSNLDLRLTSNLDLWDGGKPGTDGRPDGGIRMLWTRGDGGDGLGPLNGGLYPSTKAQARFWGTAAMEIAGTSCPYVGTEPGFGAGDSDGTIWGEGEDLCGDGLGAWSEGAPTGNEAIDEQYDNSNDIADWFNFVPDFTAAGLMIRIQVSDGVPPQDCCDVNQDGNCSSADFSAWIAAFNGSAPTCDINQDGSCSPADFSAWIAAFNASMGGNPLQCSF